MRLDFSFRLLPCVLTTTHFFTYPSAIRCSHISHPASTISKVLPAPTTLTDLSLRAPHSVSSMPFHWMLSSLPVPPQLSCQQGKKPHDCLRDRHTNWLTSVCVFSGHRWLPSKTPEFSTPFSCTRTLISTCLSYSHRFLLKQKKPNYLWKLVPEIHCGCPKG